MSRKIIPVLMVFIILVTFGITLMARNWGGPQHFGYRMQMAEKNLFPIHMILKFKAEIGLSDQQVEKIENMQLKHQEMAIKHMSEIKLLELKVASLLKSESVNRAAIEKLVRQIGKMKTDHFIQRIHLLLDVKEILTSEQMEKIEKMKSEVRMRRFRNRDSRPRR